MNSWIVSVTSTAVLAFSLVAEEPKKDPPKSEAPKDTAKAEAPDIYKLPENADATGLVAFTKTLLKVHPRTQKEAMEHRAKAQPLLKSTAEKILELEKSETTENGHFAKMTLLMLGSPRSASGPDAEKYTEDVLKHLDSDKTTVDDFSLLNRAGSIAQAGGTEKGKAFFERLEKALAKTTDKDLVSYRKSIPATLRRLNLPGHEMNLKGKTSDGKEFDLTSLKGKVVLVDFWATWCGPCMMELPNVKKNYEGYHNKGFDVVGISLDQDRTKLDAFLTKDPLPWVTLHDMQNGQHKENPAVEFYGISSIPTTVLIGKDGKVISLAARGPQLGALLKEQLGEPEAPKEPATDAAKEPAKDEKPAAPAK